MALRKVGELVVDLILRREQFERPLDDAARRAKQAGDDMQAGADKATRAYGATGTQVQSLTQRIAGLGLVAAATRVALREVGEAQDRYAQRRNAPGEFAATGTREDDSRFSAFLQTLTPTEQVQARRSRAINDRLAQNEQEYRERSNRRASANFGFGSLRGLLFQGAIGSNPLLNPVVQQQLQGVEQRIVNPGLVQDQELARRGIVSFQAARNAEARAETQSLGDSANPVFARRAELDLLQRMADSLQRLEAQGAQPQPGGAVP